MLMRHCLALSCTLPLVAAATPAQWSKDAASNSPIASGEGDQLLPSIAPGPDGSQYVGYLVEGEPGGVFGPASYAVHLQRLDAAGRALLPPEGAPIADTHRYSPQAPSLSTFSNGDACLAFLSVDENGGTPEATVTRVTRDGTEVWAVQFEANNGDSIVAAVLEDGSCVAAYTTLGVLRMRRFDANGVPQWAPDGIQVVSSTAVFNFAKDIVDVGGGDVVLSWTEGTPFSREGFVQKIDAAGTLLWGSHGIDFNQGLLFDMARPVHDGAGGIVLAYTDFDPVSAYVQRFLSDGTPVWGSLSSGINLSDPVTVISRWPAVDYRASTGHAFVFWYVQPTAGPELRGQLFDAAGSPQWGPAGISLPNPGLSAPTRVLARDDGAEVIWKQGNQAVALRVDNDGNLQYPVTTLASSASDKGPFQVARGALGDVIAVWSDDAAGDLDIVGQNLLASGALGPAAGAVSRTAPGNLPTYSAVVGPIGGSIDVTVDLTGTGYGLAAVFAYPSAAYIPFYDQVILVLPLGGELLGLPLLPGPVAASSVSIPNNPVLCGLAVYSQALYFDAVLPIRVTNAIDFYLGS